MRRFAVALVLTTLAATAPVPAATAQRAVEKPALNIAPDGISLVDPASGRSRNLRFGTPRAPVVIAANRALGKALSTGINGECGEGPIAYVEYHGGLTLHFQEGKFVGWFLGKGTPRITDAAGIGIGSTRAQLAAVRTVKLEPSTLGVEFSSGDLSGLLSNRTRTARITDLWAGSACLAR